MITFKNVSKLFMSSTGWFNWFNSLEVEALNGINFRHPEGVTLQLTGPTGAGKSVFLNLLAGFYPPDQGKVLVDEFNPFTSGEIKKKIGFVRCGENEFVNTLSARDNLELLAGWHELEKEERNQRVEEVLRFVGLDEDPGRVAVGELSAGALNRLSLAGALLPSPEYLLLDDPASHLEPPGIKSLNKLLKVLENRGITLVIASEEAGICAGLEVRRLRLEEGKQVIYHAA